MKPNLSEINERELKLIKPFGPSIAVTGIPKKIIDNLNNYTDEVINDEKKSSTLDMGSKLAGQVKQEFKLEVDFMKNSGWLNFLGQAVQNYIQVAQQKKITKFNVINSWIVRQFKNEYNPTHWHSGHISGVGYLKVPKNLGDNSQKTKTSNTNGCLELIHGSRMFLSESKLTITPGVGHFYIFPNYLMHTVYPFNDSDEERRSVSFNARVDEEIFNVL